MKKIITNPDPAESISVDDLPKFPIIGIRQYSDMWQKGWLQPTKYISIDATENPKYKAFAIDNGVGKGNGWLTLGNALGLKEWIAWANSGDVETEFFLFQSEIELFKWLVE